MKRKMIVALTALALASAAHADFKEQNEFCDTLLSMSPTIFNAGVDAYSITHHKNIGCINIPMEDMKKTIAESPMYAFLIGLNFANSESSGDRIQNTCSQLLYNIMVKQALNNGIDTIDGMKDIAANMSKESAQALQSCNNVAQSLNKNSQASK